MNTKWTSNAVSGTENKPAPPPGNAEKFGVILLYGKNPFGDKIYSFLKVQLPQLQGLRAAMQAGKGFNPSDFGTVVAAGRGEPTEEVRREVATMFEVMDAQKEAAPAAAIPDEKKKWDEY